MSDKSEILKGLGFSETFLEKLNSYEKNTPYVNNENLYFVEQIYKNTDSNTLMIIDDPNVSTSFLNIR